VELSAGQKAAQTRKRRARRRRQFKEVLKKLKRIESKTDSSALERINRHCARLKIDQPEADRQLEALRYQIDIRLNLAIFRHL
jgi:hypothetical protein